MQPELSEALQLSSEQTRKVARLGEEVRRSRANVYQEIELYDHSVDPDESNNVAGDHPDVLARLRNKLKAWVDELPDQYDKSRNKKAQQKHSFRPSNDSRFRTCFCYRCRISSRSD